MHVTEPKIVPYSLATDYPAIDNTWHEHNFGVLAEGVAGQQRLGERYYIESIYLTGHLMGGQSVAADDPYNFVRIVIGLWNMGAGTTPLASLAAQMDDPLWKKAPFTGVDPAGLAQNLKWKIWDKTIKLQSPGMMADGDLMPAVRNVTYYKKFKKPIVMQFGNVATTYANHSLIVSMISDSSLAPSPGFLTGYIYVKFRDF